MADKKYVQKEIKIPKAYSRQERMAIGQEIVDYIRARTADGRDKNGSRFPGYSKAYINSLAFKVAGKSKGEVNLKLSGDMLAVLDVLSTNPGKIKIGFDPGAPEAGRAEGNIRGTYGQASGSSSKRRDFLGIEPKALEAILDRYPLDDRAASRERAQETLDIVEGTEEDE